MAAAAAGRAGLRLATHVLERATNWTGEMFDLLLFAS